MERDLIANIGRGVQRRRAARPPRVNPGWRTAAPDFIGVGTQRSGTSWWYSLLADHPQVVAVPKELHFFDDFYERPFGDADVAAYHRFFPRPPGSISGEWTPRYAFDYWVPALLARAAPEARLLVVLRDPVERYRSGLSHSRRILGNAGRYGLAMAASDALQRSRYLEQLERLLRYFDRSQLLVLQYERCREDPGQQLRRTYEFLGLEQSTYLPDALETHVGRRHEQARPAAGLERVLAEELRPDAVRLAEAFREIDLSLWPSVAA